MNKGDVKEEPYKYNIMNDNKNQYHSQTTQHIFSIYGIKDRFISGY